MSRVGTLVLALLLPPLAAVDGGPAASATDISVVLGLARRQLRHPLSSGLGRTLSFHFIR